MTKQEEFFSPSHNRLLNIAMWTKYLAWVVFIVYILWAALQVLQTQNIINYAQTGWYFLLTNDPFRAFELIVNIAATVLRGIIYYLVLKGISLGLRMIVETDINYREQAGGVE